MQATYTGELNVTLKTPPVHAARKILQEAGNVLVLTGAGISAESGIPTFRGAGERWRDKHFLELANPAAFKRDPREIWDWYLYRRGVVANCMPNAAHLALAAWARRRTGVTLVTQNVDGLHEQAGHPDVVRLHGSLWQNRCTSCGEEREDRSLSYDALPLSPCCQALERPAIVWFHEMLPNASVNSALAAARTANVVIAIGTSGVVYPAASYISLASGIGAVVIDVNPEDNETHADIAIRLPAVEALTRLLSE